MRRARQPRQRVVRDADLELIGIFLLQLQRRDDGDEIGIAAALAEPVQRALDLPRAGAHRGERIRHGLFGVVVGVDADMIAGNFFADFADDALDLVRQRAAIGVAQHHPARAFLVSGLRAGERISGLGLVAVEEMLAVEQHFAALGLGGAHGVADRGEVLFLRGLERDAHVIVPGLGDEADGVGLARREARPGPDRSTPSGPGRRVMPKAVNFARIGRFSAKEAGVGRIGAGIAAFDIVDAELVEHARDGELVGQREIDAIGLRAVAQRRVEQIKTRLVTVSVRH